MRQLLPERREEFEQLYKGIEPQGKRTESIYCIQDWMSGIKAPKYINSDGRVFNEFPIVIHRISSQLAILKSVSRRFESTLFDLRKMVQADVFDSELDSARELLKNGFLRAAGIVAGVVLERHLSEVATSHGIEIGKKNPTIGDYNDALKNGGVIDTPPWRNIQHLADIRNLCGHNKDREPTKVEVDDLVSGVERITKTVF